LAPLTVTLGHGCRLHNEHTTTHPSWECVKDLSRLGRDLARTVIVDDNSMAFL
jgi:hypothetical protein